MQVLRVQQRDEQWFVEFPSSSSPLSRSAALLLADTLLGALNIHVLELSYHDGHTERFTNTTCEYPLGQCASCSG